MKTKFFCRLLAVLGCAVGLVLVSGEDLVAQGKGKAGSGGAKGGNRSSVSRPSSSRPSGPSATGRSSNAGRPSSRPTSGPATRSTPRSSSPTPSSVRPSSPSRGSRPSAATSNLSGKSVPQPSIRNQARPNAATNRGQTTSRPGATPGRSSVSRPQTSSPTINSRSQSLDFLRQRAESARSMADLMRAQSQNRGPSSTQGGAQTRPTPSTGRPSNSQLGNSPSTNRTPTLDTLRQRAESSRSMADLMRAQSQNRGPSSTRGGTQTRPAPSTSRSSNSQLGKSPSTNRTPTLDTLRQRAESARSMADLMRAQSQTRGAPASRNSREDRVQGSPTRPSSELSPAGAVRPAVPGSDSASAKKPDLRLGEPRSPRSAGDRSSVIDIANEIKRRSEFERAGSRPGDIRLDSSRLSPERNGRPATQVRRDDVKIPSRNTVIRTGAHPKDGSKHSLTVSTKSRSPHSARNLSSNVYRPAPSQRFDPHPIHRRAPVTYRYPHHHHHSWYHGGWSGIRFNSWYRPPCYLGSTWGFGLWINDWGYGVRYINPYCQRRPVTWVTVYDYTQPIVLQTYREPAVISSFRVDLEEPVELTSDEARSVELFDMARREFKLGRYERAMELTEQAIPLNSDDVILHEFFALTLFALGKYDESAIVLNSLLAVAPGMDAETVGSLYASPEIYARQIRTLEDHVRGDAEDVSARFVLAYHKLVAGESKEASELLGEVTRMEPDDHVARQLLVDLKRDETVSESTESELKEPLVLGVPDAVDPAEEPVEEQSTDLAGQWLASQSESKIELVLSEEGSFTWSTSQADQPTRVIRGEFVLAGDVLVLEGAEAGTFVGKVEPLGSDQFRFQFVNAPAEDSGLLFNRQK